MGAHQFPARMLGKVPTYYITDAIQEDAGGGNIRVWNYTKVKGVLVPQFECIVSSTRALIITRKISDFAQDIYNAEQLRSPGAKVH
jgi:hypothetical protein